MSTGESGFLYIMKPENNPIHFFLQKTAFSDKN